MPILSNPTTTCRCRYPGAMLIRNRDKGRGILGNTMVVHGFRQPGAIALWRRSRWITEAILLFTFLGGLVRLADMLMVVMRIHHFRRFFDARDAG